MDFFEHVQDMLLHTQRVTRKGGRDDDMSIAGMVEEISPRVEDIFPSWSNFPGFRGGVVFPTGNGWRDILAILKTHIF